MPEIIGASEGKTYAVGFWDSQICDNSLAEFPANIDSSWGIVEFVIDGCDVDNYVDVKIMSTTNDILATRRYIINGRKKLDISQFSNISSTQDIKIRFEITTWI